MSDAEKSLAPEFRAQRDKLELEVEALRARKAKLPEAEYYAQLEPLLVKLARLYQAPPVHAADQNDMNKAP